MSHSKGKLHRHDLSIHIERKIDDTMSEHTCIANMNDSSYLDNEANAEHFLKCWNSHDALLAACEAMACEWDERGKEMYGGVGAPSSIFEIKQVIAKVNSS